LTNFYQYLIIKAKILSSDIKKFFEMKDAANNPSNPMVSGGVGIGAGVGLGAIMAEAMRGATAPTTSTPAQASAPAPQGQTTVCSSCGKTIPQGVKFCPECGASNKPKFCTNCGTKLEPTDKFCSNCGQKA